MDAKEFATGLRQIADWYEAHPDVALPYDNYGSGMLTVYNEVETKERVAEIARSLGFATKVLDPESPFLKITRSFNGVVLGFVFNRDTVCTARVVGTRIIPARPAQEAQPEHEEDIIEWDCHPILSEQQA